MDTHITDGLSAGLEAIEGDKALNTHRDGTLTLTFSHDIDPANCLFRQFMSRTPTAMRWR